MGSAIYTATTTSPSSHTYVAGTSFAAPHVAALAALLFSMKPSLTAEQVVNRIKDSADNIDAANMGYAGSLGAGRINARKALESEGGAATTFTITVSAGDNGAIVPAGPITVPKGSSQRFDLVPNPGYEVGNVRIDGNSVGVHATYTLINVLSDQTISAVFIEISTTDSGMPVNLNTANEAELEALPQIGPWMANQIIIYRETVGNFTSIWDLEYLGMSRWAISQIEELITV
jgi:subtilisin family serine protease